MTKFSRIPKEVIQKECFKILRSQLATLRGKIKMVERETSGWIPQNREMLLKAEIEQQTRLEASIKQIETLPLREYKPGEYLDDSAVLVIQRIGKQPGPIQFCFVLRDFEARCEFSITPHQVIIGTHYSLLGNGARKPGDKIQVPGPHDSVAEEYNVLDLY